MALAAALVQLMVQLMVPPPGRLGDGPVAVLEDEQAPQGAYRGDS